MENGLEGKGAVPKSIAHMVEDEDDVITLVILGRGTINYA